MTSWSTKSHVRKGKRRALNGYRRSSLWDDAKSIDIPIATCALTVGMRPQARVFDASSTQHETY